MANYETSVSRIIWAIAAGAIVGGVVTGLIFSADSLSSQIGLRVFSFVTPVAAIFWLGGIVIAGCPIWYWLHRNRYRSWLTGACLGVVAPTAMFLVIYVGTIGAGFYKCTGLAVAGHHCDPYADLIPMKDWGILLAGISLCAVGSIVGVTIWRIAYRRVETSMNS